MVSLQFVYGRFWVDLCDLLEKLSDQIGFHLSHMILALSLSILFSLCLVHTLHVLFRNKNEKIEIASAEKTIQIVRDWKRINGRTGTRKNGNKLYSNHSGKKDTDYNR